MGPNNVFTGRETLQRSVPKEAQSIKGKVPQGTISKYHERVAGMGPNNVFTGRETVPQKFVPKVSKKHTVTKQGKAKLVKVQ